MSTLTGNYFNGKVSRRFDATLMVQNHKFVVVPSDPDEPMPVPTVIDDLRISSRLDLVPRSIRFPGGEQFITEDNDAVDSILEKEGVALESTLAHKLESYIPFVVASWVGLVCFCAWFYFFAIPMLVDSAVSIVPKDWELELGRQGYEQMLDQGYFEEVEYTGEYGEYIDWLVGYLEAHTGSEQPVEIHVVNSPVFGANAFALPGGVVVVTDDLVDLAETNEEILAVYFHELGHVHGQHSLRYAFHSSLLSVFITAVTGDVTAAADIAVTLPTVMLTLKHSRDYEVEADAYAIDKLREHGYSVDPFASIMTRLEESAGADNPFVNSDYLSSHPSTDKRIMMMRAQHEG